MNGHSDNAGAPSGASPSGPGIFSDPNLSINAANIPSAYGGGVVGGGDTFGAMGSAALGAATPQPLTPPQSSTGRIDASTAEDIRLVPEQKKRHTGLKVFLILLLVGALSAGGGFAYYNFVYLPSSEPVLKSAALDSFSRFANLLLYAEDKTDPVSGYYQYGDRYWLSSLSLTPENRAEHLDAASVRLGAFYSAYDKLKEKYPESAGEEARALLENYRREYEFFRYNIVTPALSAEQVLSGYLSDPAKILTLVSEYYAPYNDAPLDELRDFAAGFISEANPLINSFQTFKKYNCIDTTNVAIVSSCLNIENPVAPPAPAVPETPAPGNPENPTNPANPESQENEQEEESAEPESQETITANLKSAAEIYKKYNNYYSEKTSPLSEYNIKVFQSIWKITWGLQ